MKLGKDTFPQLGKLIVPPGATLQEALDDRGMTQAELATRTGLSKKTINRIIQGHEPLTYETADLLERVTGVPSSLWNNLEANYRGRLARNKANEQLAQAHEWVKRFPLEELIERGAIERQSDKVELARATLTFFGVSSREQWEAVWLIPDVAFRKSEAFKDDPEGVATWLRLGERIGRTTEIAPFNKERFQESLGQIRGLTIEEPGTFIPQVKELCAEAGVVVALVPEIRDVQVSGAAYWLTPDKAIIQLTLRGGSDDKFWFTFFHEAGHVLKHGKKEKFVDDGDSVGRLEHEADRFAENLLIPPGEAKRLPELKTRQQIVDFARALGIAPGIVVGRLQNLGLLGHKAPENSLKKTFRWKSMPHAGDAEITLA